MAARRRHCRSVNIDGAVRKPRQRLGREPHRPHPRYRGARRPAGILLLEEALAVAAPENPDLNQRLWKLVQQVLADPAQAAEPFEVVVELQLFLEAFLDKRKLVHGYYKIARAPHLAALARDCAAKYSAVALGLRPDHPVARTRYSRERAAAVDRSGVAVVAAPAAAPEPKASGAAVQPRSSSSRKPAPASPSCGWKRARRISSSRKPRRAALSCKTRAAAESQAS